jgi:hypothetical protein
MDEHMISQAVEGEYSPLVVEAAGSTPEQFAKKHNSKVRNWGHRDLINYNKNGKPRHELGPSYYAVKVDGTDYLWRADSMEFDGWDRPM